MGLRKILGAILLVFLVGCNECKECPVIDVDECPDEFCGESDGPKPTATPTPAPTNPVCEGVGSFSDGPNGMLWKPESDNDGKIVVLVNSEFTQEFDRCTAELRSGGLDELYCNKGPWNDFSCFSNGNRLTLRGHYLATKYKPKGFVRCYEQKQTCSWRIPNDPTKRAD